MTDFEEHQRRRARRDELVHGDDDADARREARRAEGDRRAEQSRRAPRREVADGPSETARRDTGERQAAEQARRDERIDGNESTLDAIPGVAHIAASAAWHTAGWGARTYVNAVSRLLRAATSPDSAVELADSARTVAKDFVDGTDLEDRVRALKPLGHREEGDETTIKTGGSVPRNQLHDAGEELMRKGRDVRYEEEAHPAYERILAELAPDEGRILRLLLVSGPQPTVDVRTGGPLGIFSSRLIAPGLSMIGARAGVRYLERVPSYLNNLHRLGLVWFSRETLRDVHRYQVLEAQPDVLEAMESVRYAKLVRRSIHLTPFGDDFCRVCLGLRPEQLESLPAHSSPLEADKVASPPAE